MLVTDLVLETLPGGAAAVVERLGSMKGMESIAADGDHRVTARWRVPDGDTCEGLVEVLQAMNPEIVHVVPTFEGRED